MSKFDEMRRQREERVAQSARQAAGAPKRSAVVAEPKAAAEAPVKAAKSVPAAADVTEGRCPSCGKTKPVANGVMANHQHGLGKPCPGSRKPPA